MPTRLPTTSATATTLRATLDFLTFQYHSGVRLSWRVLGPAVCGFALALLLIADQLPIFGAYLEEAQPPVRLLLLVLIAGFAETTAPRIRRGGTGWVIHLPLGDRARRRGWILANALALLPVAALIGAVFLAAAPTFDRVLFFASGLVLALIGVSLPMVPQGRFRRRWVQLLGWAATYLALGTAAEQLAAVLLLVVGDQLLGPIMAQRPKALGRLFLFSWLSTETKIAGRACAHGLPGAFLLALLPVAAGYAFVVNNPLSAAGTRLGSTLAAGLSMTLLIGVVSELLRTARPTWPWARTLPSSGLGRVARDGTWLAGLAAPSACAGVWLHPAAFLPVACLWLATAALGTAAVRCRPNQYLGSGSEVLLIGGLLSAFAALRPLLGSLLALLLFPGLLVVAARRDRSLQIGRWDPSAILAEGDSLDPVS